MNDFVRALLIGRSKHGKTTSLYYLSKMMVEMFDKTVRIVNTDGGSDYYWERTEMFKNKKLFVCYPNRFQHKIAVMKEIASGYWPIKAGKSKVMDDKDQAIFVDGMSSTARMMIRHLANHDELIGKKHALAPAGVFYDGDQRIAVNSQSHYNVVHQGLEELVNKMFTLPVHVVWTALQTEGITEEEQTVYGPKTVGKAITTEITSWFPDTWHQERWNVKGEIRYRVWFEQHEDKKTGIEYLCGIRLYPEEKVKLLEKWPKGYMLVNETSGMHEYYFNWRKGENRNDGQE